MESLLISQVVANNFGALRETLQMLRGGRHTDNDDHGKELTLAWSDSHCDSLTALDLFTGSGAVTTGLESHNYKVLNIDFSSKGGNCEPKLLLDARAWDYTVLPRDRFDFVWMSPPCAVWSCMQNLNVEFKTANVSLR